MIMCIKKLNSHFKILGLEFQNFLFILFIHVKCLNRVAERLEETVGAAPVEVSKVIKTKFVSMVEGHYLIRVKPPASEATLQNQSSGERAGEGANLPIFGEFELPPSLNGTNW